MTLNSVGAFERLRGALEADEGILLAYLSGSGAGRRSRLDSDYGTAVPLEGLEVPMRHRTAGDRKTHMANLKGNQEHLGIDTSA
ncbi:MAG: hypothetical protein ACE5Z5_14110 [Candidatus Bathyarchaeia archaeon]